jgi:hypothetical protein
VILSFLPYYGLSLTSRGPAEDCRNVQNPQLHQRCVDKAVGLQTHAHLHWNAWGSFFSWPAIVLLLAVAVVVGFKAIFAKSDKVILSRHTRLGLLIGDALFLIAIVHIPHDNAGRAWALWLSLVCVLALNVGVLLATTNAGEWVVEHWPNRSARSTDPAATVQAATPHGWPAPTAPFPSNQGGPSTSGQGTATDYRPTPQAAPPGQRPAAWPQQPGNFGQGGFPTQSDQPPRT